MSSRMAPKFRRMFRYPQLQQTLLRRHMLTPSISRRMNLLRQRRFASLPSDPTRPGVKFSGLYIALSAGVLTLAVPIIFIPLYRAICQQFGLTGTMLNRRSQKKINEMIAFKNSDETAEEEEERLKYKIKVRFDSNVPDMPWKFRPLQKEIMVTPGETALAFFEAENLTDKAMTGISTYNVTPPKAALYFTKIECFCFNEQRLRPHEKIDMPVLFYIDPAIMTDYRTKGKKFLTLQYTFFDCTADYEDEDYDDADEDRTYSLGESARETDQPINNSKPLVAL